MERTEVLEGGIKWYKEVDGGQIYYENLFVKQKKNKKTKRRRGKYV